MDITDAESAREWSENGSAAGLRGRSDARGGARLAIHLGLLGATGWAVHVATGAWLVPALFAHGVMLVFLFAPLHECVHRTAFRTRALNDAVARACGLVLLLPPGYFRFFHLAHHRYTQDPARDPELAVPRPTTFAGYLWAMSGLPYWRERAATLPRHAWHGANEGYIPRNQREQVKREARLFLALYALALVVSVLAGSDVLLRYWLAPCALGMPALRAFLLAEHAGCPQVADMLRNTRTTRSNTLVRLLAWNMPYHVEHHACASVPFHALPALHERLHARIENLAPGYLYVHTRLLRALAGGRGRGA